MAKKPLALSASCNSTEHRVTLFHDVVSSPVAFPTKGRLPVAFPPTSVCIIVNGLKTVQNYEEKLEWTKKKKGKRR
jgi:hypothetical protein